MANANTAFTRNYAPGQVIRCPVAHHDGNYFADAETLARLEGEGQVVFRYAEGTNPNGSINDIAGIVNAGGNVLGLMPHPENLIEAAHGGTDGRAAVRKRARCWPQHDRPLSRSTQPARTLLMRIEIPTWQSRCCLIALSLLPLAACQSEQPGQRPEPAAARAPRLRSMEQVAIAAHKCWFASKDPAFRPYRMPTS